MDSTDDDTPCFEHSLARDWNVPKPVLARFRGTELTEGTDWHRHSLGIALTPDAAKKMKAALGLLGAPAPDTIDVVIAMVLSLRHVRARLGDQRIVKVLIESRPGGGMAPTATLATGVVLRRCRWLNPDLLAYNGPLPRRRGHQVPEAVSVPQKKEPAL